MEQRRPALERAGAGFGETVSGLLQHPGVMSGQCQGFSDSPVGPFQQRLAFSELRFTLPLG